MVWTVSIPVPGGEAVSIAQDDLSAGEWAAIFELTAKALAHAETEVHPMHCPLCRNAIAVTALISRAAIAPAHATMLVNETGRDELAGYVGWKDPPA